MSQSFIHLHLHTEYSLVDSVVRIPTLMDKLVEQGVPAVALTDQSNLFALVKFYRAALSRGIKPIIGADIFICVEDEPSKPFRMLLLCLDNNGYRNLSRLISKSYLDGQHHGVPMLSREMMTRESCEGLIALSGGQYGDIGRALLSSRPDDAETLVRAWQDVFPNCYYLEIQRTGRLGDETYLHEAVALSSKVGIPLVATNDVRFLVQGDFESHEARVCIHEGHTLTDTGRPRRYSEHQHLRSPKEMARLFGDLPEALENSVNIARRCNVVLSLGGTHLPVFPIPKDETVESYLRHQATAGLDQRLFAAGTKGDDQAVYIARLETELNVIDEMGYPGYFLIVADFISWARDNRIPVGPGRGSGAGSLVAWSLGITDLDPIAHELLFERFLNPERVSMPDFDVDFCMEGRDRVIEYVADKYGRDKVSQIITYGTMAAKAVVRDVGRVLGHPYGFVDRIAKLIPFEIGMTLDRALVEEDELGSLYKDDDEVRAIIDLARSLEGLVRNAGKHAGGVVIAPSVLTDFTPLYCEDAGSNAITQFDKDDVESVGLVKFDFLGLRTLTIIDRAVAIINDGHTTEQPLDITALPQNDKKTFDLLKSCQTTAVFQLESRGMKDLIKRLQPDNFGEIVALVALFRPGPLQSGMVDEFINRKHGRNDAPINYLHPDLKSILEPTYGVILYQEQVMQIAQTLAGYSLGAADLLRRAMGKKKPDEMAKQRSIFVDGAASRGVDAKVSSYIFDLMEKFAGYGFNKSHSAAYAVLAYQTAWLKAHYPAAFMAAVLSSDMDHTDKIVTLIDECASMGLEIMSPDVNSSEYMFAMRGDRSIRYGLGAIKGIGKNAVEALIDERNKNGVYRSLDNLCQRVDMQKTNRRVLEALIRSGSVDALGNNRATLMARLPVAIRLAEQDAQSSAAGIKDMFGFTPEGSGGEPAAVQEVVTPDLPEWSDKVLLAAERETLGLYLSGHPIAEYEADLSAITSGRIVDLVSAKPMTNGNGWKQPQRNVRVAGLVTELRKRGNRVTLILDDRSGRIEVSLFDDTYQRYRNIVTKDNILVIDGAMRYDDFIDGWRVTAKEIMEIDHAREQYARRIIINWKGSGDGESFVHDLKEVLQPYRQGSCGVFVSYSGLSARARLALSDDWTVRPTRELIDRLSRLVGEQEVKIVYPPRVEVS